MSTGTVFPELAMGVTATITHAFEAGHVEEWPVGEASAVLSLYHEARQVLRGWRKSVEKALGRGVDVQSFVGEYDSVVERLGQHLSTLTKLAQEARSRPLPPQAEETISALEDLRGAMADYRAFLADALAKMKASRRPIDWTRVEKAREAHSKFLHR